MEPIPFECLTFLENITFTEDFRLGQDIEVRRATEEELEIYQKYFFPTIDPSEEEVSGLEWLERDLVIMNPYPTPTHVLICRKEIELEDFDSNDILEHLQEEIEVLTSITYIVITALRFCTRKMVGNSGYIYLYTGNPLIPKFPKLIDISSKFDVHETELERFDSKKNIKQLSEILETLFFLQSEDWIIGLTRFNSTYAKKTNEDRIIDLSIAFESLFDINRELSFRLSLYLGNLIGDNKAVRKEIRNFFNLAYKFRSQIVHGSKIKDEKLKKMGVLDLHGFYLKLREYFVIAIGKICQYSCKNKK